MEKLTEDERACIQFDAGQPGEKALRIIDAQAAALDRVRALADLASSWVRADDLDEALDGDKS